MNIMPIESINPEFNELEYPIVVANNGTGSIRSIDYNIAKQHETQPNKTAITVYSPNNSVDYYAKLAQAANDQEIDGTWRPIKSLNTEPKALAQTSIIEFKPNTLDRYAQLATQPIKQEEAKWRVVEDSKMLEKDPSKDPIQKDSYYDNWRFIDEQNQIEAKPEPKFEIVVSENPTNQTTKPEIAENEQPEPEVDLAEPNQMEIYLAKRVQVQELFDKSNKYVQSHIAAMFAAPAWQQLEYEKARMTDANVKMMTTSLDSVLDFYKNPGEFSVIMQKRYDEAMINAKILKAQNPHLENDLQLETNLNRMAFLQARALTHSSRFFEYVICMNEFEKMVQEKKFAKFSINQVINNHRTRINLEQTEAEAQKNNSKLTEILSKNAQGIKRILNGEEGKYDPMVLNELRNTTKVLISDLNKKKAEQDLQSDDLVMAVETTRAINLFFDNTPEFKKFMLRAYSQTADWFEFIEKTGNTIDPELREGFKHFKTILGKDILTNREFSKIRKLFEIKQQMSREYTRVISSMPKHQRPVESAPNYQNRQAKPRNTQQQGNTNGQRQQQRQTA